MASEASVFEFLSLSPSRTSLALKARCRCRASYLAPPRPSTRPPESPLFGAEIHGVTTVPPPVPRLQRRNSHQEIGISNSHSLSPISVRASPSSFPHAQPETDLNKTTSPPHNISASRPPIVWPCARFAFPSLPPSVHSPSHPPIPPQCYVHKKLLGIRS